MSGADLAAYLERPLSEPSPEVIAEIERGPIDRERALPLGEVDRLRDPAPLPVETGWCTLDDGSGFVAVSTPMPGVSAEMVDWWFDWHPRDPLRYRIWHPLAHRSNSLESPVRAGVKLHWGATHHPVEDVGLGVVHARIGFQRPSEMGFSSDVLDDSAVATVVCGYAGDDRRRLRHTPMYHVFLAGEGGVRLRSHFWLGAAIRPYGPLGAVGERLLNIPRVRRRALPRGLPHALAMHCAEEYANLAALLPELHARFAPR